MKQLGPSGLFYYASVIYLVMATFTLYRMSKRAPVPDEDQTAFVPQPQTSQSSPVVTALDPRVQEGEKAVPRG